MKARTSISVNNDTYTKLAEVGKFGQSYTDVIEFLIEFYMQNKGGKTKK